MREMMRMVWMLCRMDPVWGMALASVMLAVPVIVVGAAGAFFPDEADELIAMENDWPYEAETPQQTRMGF